MAESANFTTVPPIETSIEDANGVLWTLRLSDRAVLKAGASTRINNVLMIWYIDHVVYAFKGTHWRQYDEANDKWIALVAQIDTGLAAAFPGRSGAVNSYNYQSVKADVFPTLPPLGFLTTPGLRRATGVKALASHAGVSLPTGTDPQTIINANPPGTTFVFATGTHTSRSIVPRTGDIFVGLTGTILDGGGNTDFAFSGGASYVTLYNLTITNYTANVQHGMVERLGPYLLMQDCTLTANTRGAGASYLDFALTVACKLNNNNQQGYCVHGDFTFVPIVGVCFYSTEITGNNPTGGTWAGSEQGGGKGLDTEHLTFLFCWSGLNQGSNHWSDYNNYQVMYYGGSIGGLLTTDQDTGWNGVEHEISENCKVLYNNIYGIAAGPGGLAGFLSTAAVFTGNSGGVQGGWYEIAHNNIVCSQYGRAITARMQTRSVQDQYGVPGEPRWNYNMYVHHNTIDIRPATGVTNGHVGMQTDNGSDIIFYGPGRPLFNMNTYQMGTIFTPFVWGSPGLGPGQWQSFGQDPDSTFNVDPEPPGLSQIFKNSHVGLSGSPLLVATSDGASSYSAGRTTSDYIIHAGDKKYWEVVITFENGQNRVGVGFCNAAETFLDAQFVGSQLSGVGFYCFLGEVYLNGVLITHLASYVISQTVSVAYQGGVGYWFRVDGGNWNNDPSANPTTGVGALDASSFGDVFPAYTVSFGGTLTFRLTTGFAFTIPSGFSGF